MFSHDSFQIDIDFTSRRDDSDYMVIGTGKFLDANTLLDKKCKQFKIFEENQSSKENSPNFTLDLPELLLLT